MTVYAVIILIVSLIPIEPTVSAPGLDKVAHVCEYLLFAWILVQALLRSRADKATAKQNEPPLLLWAWLYATSYGALIEVLQAMVPWRSADWADALSNAFGAALGVWIGQQLPLRKT